MNGILLLINIMVLAIQVGHTWLLPKINSLFIDTHIASCYLYGWIFKISSYRYATIN